MDIGTLFAAQSVMLVGYAVVLALVARSQPDLKGIRWLARAYALATVATLWSGWLRGPFAPWMDASHHAQAAGARYPLGSPLVVLDDLLLVIPFLLCRRGLAEFLERDPQHWLFDAPVFAVAVLGFITFGILHPSSVATDLLYTLVAGVESGLCCYLLFRFRPKGMRASIRVMLTIFAVLALGCAVRVASTLIFGAPLLAVVHGHAPGTIILTRMLASFSIAFCFVWMATERLRSSLEDLAQTDYLTGTLNRRSLREYAEREIAQCQRTGQLLSVLVVDIDNFKRVNDTHGHSVGDESLRQVAATLNSLLRRSDLLARYGGEEFVLLLPGTTGENARLLAERLRMMIEALALMTPRGAVRLTASFGVAQLCSGGETWEAFLARADLALYAAKEAGRNCTVLAAQS